MTKSPDGIGRKSDESAVTERPAAPAPMRAAEPESRKPDVTSLAKLREKFADNQISKLPKMTKRQLEEARAGTNVIACQVCGARHHQNAVHLDYVGHAAITARLLDTDPNWNWEPMAITPEGLPAFDRTGGLWIKLTVCGFTRIGYGNAASSKNDKDTGAREKEVIGDALRNAAMRFGAALELWHKGDLYAQDEAAEEAERAELAKAKLVAVSAAIDVFRSRQEAYAWLKSQEAMFKEIEKDNLPLYNEIVRRWNAKNKTLPQAEQTRQMETSSEPARQEFELDDEIPF